MTAALTCTAHQTLEDQITELAAHISAATWRLLTLIRDYDLCAGWNGGGTKSCAHWLNWKCGIALGAAREKVRVAHALAKLPQIDAAFREGRLSYSKVRAMTRVATPENEDYLLMIARHGTASHVELLVRSYRRVTRREAREQLAQRKLTYHVDDDGCFRVSARLTPEQGERLLLALDAAMDAPAAGDERSLPERRADALEAVLDGYLAQGPGDSSGGDRYTLHLHAQAEDLQAPAGDDDVSAETTRRAACDCGVVHWQENDRGQALNIGRRSRNITPALRRALEHRDGGCSFPGCTTQRHVDAHHVVHWADGGETRLDNLVLLCRHHHRLVHEGGFGVTLRPDGEKHFTGPNGSALPPAGDGRFRGNGAAMIAGNARDALRIDPRTLPPRWHGERMDLGMAIDALLRRDDYSGTSRSSV